MDNNKITNLVVAAQKGDSAALNDLFNATYNDIYYFALKTLKSEDLACDITQDTFIAIIDNLNSLKEPAAFMGWAKKIAYSKCTRYFNKKKDVLVEEDEDGNSIFDIVAEDKAEFIPDEALDQAEFKKAVHSILSALSEEQRSAVMMYYFDEMSVREIAEIQNVSEGTVKSRLNYARKAIKNSVEDYEKKNNIKLHAIPFFPFLRWILGGSVEGGLPFGSAMSMAENISAATGANVTATQIGVTGSATATAAEGASAVTGATATVTGTATSTTSTAGVATGASAGASAMGATGAASTATTAVAAGLGAKLAAIPLVTKIVAGVVAIALVAGGITTAVLLSDSKTKKKGSRKNDSVEISYNSQNVSAVIPNFGETSFEGLPTESSIPVFEEDEIIEGSIESSEPTEEPTYKYADIGFPALGKEHGPFLYLNGGYIVTKNGDVYYNSHLDQIGKVPVDVVEYKIVLEYVVGVGRLNMMSANMGNGNYYFLILYSDLYYEVGGNTLTLTGVDGNLVYIVTDENCENIVRYITEKDGIFYLNHITDNGIVTTTIVFDVEVSKYEYQNFTQVEEIYGNYTYAKLNNGIIIDLEFKAAPYTEIDEVLTEPIFFNSKYDEIEWGANKLECANTSRYVLMYNSLSDTHIYYYTLDSGLYTSSARTELPEGYTVGDIVTANELSIEFSDGGIYIYYDRYDKWYHSETLNQLNGQGKITAYYLDAITSSGWSNSYSLHGQVLMDDGVIYDVTSMY